MSYIAELIMKQRNYPSILSVIVPVFNEAKAMADLLPIWIPYCQNKNWMLILINDGSFDDTAKILASYEAEKNVMVINHKLNRGYGGAIKSGILKATTRFIVTIDGDGQHNIDDINKLLTFALEKDADMIVGSRSIYRDVNWYRTLGKWIIRKFTGFLMPLPIYDLNSGFKLYRTDLAKNFIHMCPDSMAYSDIITLMYINQRHLVLEYPILINERMTGISTINTYTAFETVIEILNLTMLFNPLRIFLPLSIFCIAIGLGWGTPFVLSGKGVSVGSMLAIVIGILFFFLGLLASQLSALRIGSLAQDEKIIDDQLTVFREKKR